LRPNRHSGRSFLIFGMLVMIPGCLTGCGYRIAGRSNSLPPGIRTIAVPVFMNRTTDYRIEQRFTQAVVRELLARTQYRVAAKPEDADAVLLGEVNSIEGNAEVFDSTTGRATTILITVTLKASLEERASGNVLYKNDNFLFREPYEVSIDLPTLFQQQGPALDRMARDFAARLVSNMLGNF